MANYLVLMAAEKHRSYLLPVGADLRTVRQSLIDSDIQSYVPVQVVLKDQLHEQTLYVRLAGWDAWMIHDVAEADSGT